VQLPAAGEPGALLRHHVLARWRALLLLVPRPGHLLPVQPPDTAQRHKHCPAITVPTIQLTVTHSYAAADPRGEGGRGGDPPQTGANFFS